MLLKVFREYAFEDLAQVYDPCSVFRDPPYSRRMLLVSGFARGVALVHQNERMNPTPVCVILEDDAILVDGFVDRLDSLLAEIPRDFHFCSLGYGRPKTAPLLPYSSQLGIPTFLWYLTGYIISLDGAKYLLEKLPVVGPVDSWIGQLQFANWENEYGRALGLGAPSSKRPAGGCDISKSMPPRKELSQLLQFRAFAALVPLCSQKVGGQTALDALSGHTRGRNWRKRDTDIVYSGSQVLKTG